MPNVDAEPASGRSDRPGEAHGNFSTERDCVVCEIVLGVADRPVLGVRPGVAVLAWGVLLGFVVTVASALVVESAVHAGVDHPAFTYGRDAAWLLARFVALALVPASIGYALWNGGPVTAAVLGSAPLLVTISTRSHLALSGDVVAPLVVASVAATVAVVAAERRATTDRPDGDAPLWRPADLENGLFVATTLAAIATATTVRLVTAETATSTAWVEPLGLLLVPTGGVLAWGWYRWWRGPRSPRSA